MTEQAHIFPRVVRHDGKTYSATGKVGTVIKTGERSAEYRWRADGLDARVWLTASGNIIED